MKKIALICEGSYPYITGGVSSWVNALINEHKEYQFIIIALIPSEDFADPKYKIPDNVIEIKKIVLNNIPVPEYFSYDERFETNSEIVEIIKKFFKFNKLSPEEMLQSIEHFSKYGDKERTELFLGMNFWKAIMHNYNKNKYSKGLNEYYWIYKNLFANLITLGKEMLPEADIYHSVSTGYAGLFLALAKYRGQGKTLITEHGIYFREREEDILSAKWISQDFKEEWINYFDIMCKTSYHFSDKVISLFKYNGDYALEHGLSPDKLLLIPNGIDIEDYDKIVRRKEEIFAIGSVLRVVPIKDVKMMIKAFKIAVAHMENSHLYLIGPTDEDEEYYEECLELVKDLKMEEHITFTGRANVKEYYEFLDIFLLSSISEGQPLSILEAMAAGIPCISTNVGNCYELLVEKTEIGEAGLVVPSTDYVGLADAIVELYNSPDRLKKMGKNGKEIVKKYYSKELFRENYKKVYSDLLKEE